MIYLSLKDDTRAAHFESIHLSKWIQIGPNEKKYAIRPKPVECLNDLLKENKSSKWYSIVATRIISNILCGQMGSFTL